MSTGNDKYWEGWIDCKKLMLDTMDVLRPPTLSPPKLKRYRPYTPAEAVQFLGQTVEDQCGTLRIISAIGSGYVMGSGHDTMTYEYMAKNCKWYISGEPCGVEVSDE